ncbi:MAG: AIM24 family protein [Chloroflexales bacterium]
MTATPLRSYTCAWCGTVSDGTALDCPGCGISIDVRQTTTRSGWLELPGRRDMAKIQFGSSSCQIEGTYVPVADMSLDPSDSVYFAHHVLLWMDTQVKVSALPLKGAWKRMLAGMPLVMTQAQGPGHIAFSKDRSGELIVVPLQPGQQIDVREHIFLVATSNVAYDWFNPNIWFTTKNGDETETHYPVGMLMDRFSSRDKPGLLLLHAAGNAFIRQLAPGEAILVKPTALLFKDPSVQMQLHFEYPGSTGWSFWSSWSHRQLWLRLYGPGRVAVQSAYEPIEDNGRSITSHSNATSRSW